MVRIVVGNDAVSLTFFKEIFKVYALFNDLIYGIFQFGFSRQTLTSHIPFPMALALACFGVLNDRQIMLSAYLVRQVTELLIGTVFLRNPAVFVCLKSPAVPHIHIIENNVQMYMRFIGVNGKKILILIF